MIGAILSLNTVQSLSRIISILLCFPDKMNISSVEIKKSIHLYYRGVDIKAKKKVGTIIISMSYDVVILCFSIVHTIKYSIFGIHCKSRLLYE